MNDSIAYISIRVKAADLVREELRMQTEFNERLELVQWKEEPPPKTPHQMKRVIPYVTHSGVIQLEGRDLRVYKLSTGHTVVDQADLYDFMEAFGLIVSPRYNG